MINHRIGLLILLITIQQAENVLNEQQPSNGLYRGVLHQEYQERLARDAHSNSEDILGNRENQERFNRDAVSNAEDFLERTSALARISNGISLQNGLLNGSIPMDNVIVEFLNFGSTSVSDVANFKPSRVLLLTSSLRTMPKTLDASDDVKAIEKQTLIWNEVHKESKNIGDFNTLPGSDDYYANATEFKAKVDLKALSAVGGELNSILTHLDEVEGITSDSEKNDARNALINLQSGILSVNHTFLSLENMNLKSYSTLENVQFFQPVEKFILLQKKRSGLNKKVDTQQETKIDALSAEVFKLMPGSKDARRDVSLLSDFVSSRIDSQTTHHTFTIGFKGDVTEINKVSADLRSAWFAQLFPGGLVDKLKDGLKPLVNSKRSLETVNTQLSPISSSDKLNSLRTVAGLQADIVALPSSSKPGEVSKELYNCFSMNNQATDDWFTGINTATSSSKELAGKLVVLKVLESGDDGMLSGKDLNDFDQLLLSYSSNFQRATHDEIVRAATELKTSGKLKLFKDKVARLAARLKEVSGTDFAELVGRVVDGEAELDLFQNETTTINEFKVYECLKPKEKGLEEASTTIQVIQTLRSLNTGVVDDVETVASTVSNVSTSIPTLRKIPSAMKKEENTESKELKNMTGHLMISKVLGESRTVLKNSMGLASLESSLTGLDTSKQVATQEIANVSDPSTKQKIQKKWTSIDSDLSTLKRGMVPIKSFLAASSLPTTLDGYGSRIKNLTTIPSMNINLTEKVEAVDLLIPLVQDAAVKTELAKSKSSLEKLDALDLDFSKYKTSLGKAPTAFKDFDSFLRWFLIPPPVAPLQKTPDGTASPAQVAEAEKKMMEAEKKKEEEGGGIPFWVWILIGGVVLVFIVVGIVVGILLHKKKKEEEAERARIAEDQKRMAQLADQLIEDAEKKEQEAKKKADEEEKERIAAEEKAAKEKKESDDARQKAEEEKLKAVAEKKKADEDKQKAEEDKLKAVADKRKADEDKKKAVAAKRKADQDKKKAEDKEKKAVAKQESEKRKNEKLNVAVARLNADLGEKAGGRQQAEFSPIKFVKKLTFKTFMDLYNFHFAAMVQVKVELKPNPEEEEKESQQYLPKRKHRTLHKPMIVAEGVYMPELQKDGKPMPIHANIISAGDATFIATQGPLVADETHDDTLEDFWHMIMLKGSEFIAMLCNFEELGTDGPRATEKKMRPKCGRYFNEENGGSKTCGRYVVTTKTLSTKLDDVETENVVTRTFEVEDKKREFEPRTVTHFHYITWPDGSIPAHSPHTLVNLVDKVSASKTPVVVHCSQGIGRTMVFIGIKYVISDLLRNPTHNWSQSICLLRHHRRGAIQCLRQSMYLQVGVVLKLSQHYNLDMKFYNEQYKVMCDVHNQDNWPPEQKRVVDGRRRKELENGHEFEFM